jgi:YD repeat-containing protein
MLQVRTHNACMAAAAAAKYGRPVRLVFSRAEDMEITGHRHEFYVDYDVDYDEEGRIIREEANSAIICFLFDRTFFHKKKVKQVCVHTVPSYVF